LRQFFYVHRDHSNVSYWFTENELFPWRLPRNLGCQNPEASRRLAAPFRMTGSARLIRFASGKS
jgi:hypothetical protein